MAWNYTKNGLFSVKSVYHLNMQLRSLRAGRAASSISMSNHAGWLSLWAEEVPGKAKIHVWRMIKNGLALGVELHRRHIKEGVKCVVCNREETLLHRFWDCPHSLDIWNHARDLSGLQMSRPDDSVRQLRDLQGWLLDWLGNMKDKELSICIMIMYQMWLARNEAREEHSIDEAPNIVRRSLALVEEWINVTRKEKEAKQPAQEHWLPPAIGWCKANVDGEFRLEDGIGGCGVVLRDHDGRFLSGESHFLTSIPDAERAELMACKRALIIRRDAGINNICLESDCLAAVAKLKSSDVDRSVHGPLVEEIKVLLRGFTAFEIRHARRSCNGVAHVLAKVSCCNKSSYSWVDSPPDFVVNLLASDASGLI
jgi:ribonuclease HI